MINEKAVSKAQRQLMGMAYAYKKGKLKKPSKTVKKLGDSMSLKDLRDFASTSEKNLPNKVGEQINDDLEEQSWEGTTNAMKKHKNIKNPFALVNFMKQKGYKPHYTKKGKKLKESFSLLNIYLNFKK